MKFFEKLIEWLFVIRVALSPTLLGIVVGSYFYFTASTVKEEILSISIAVTGLILGIVLVIYVKRKRTAVEFMTQIMATPELDKKKKELEK